MCTCPCAHTLMNLCIHMYRIHRDTEMTDFQNNKISRHVGTWLSLQYLWEAEARGPLRVLGQPDPHRKVPDQEILPHK